MKKIRIRKRTAYATMIPAVTLLITAAWHWFGPYSVGALVSIVLVYFVPRFLIPRLFLIVD